MLRDENTVTGAGRAVFVSYASQDAPVAKVLCDALRAAGIEVWFDQSELRGGDAWDALIRRQIKGCYLFVPLISANTQSREEGYFRREWRLAVDRTSDMADGRAFLIPVVVDATSDADALVPEKFREVQWTRLSAGANTDLFVAQVRRLLTPGASSSTPAAARTAAQPGAAPNLAPAQSSPVAYRRFVALVAVVILILALGYFGAEKWLISKHAGAAAETVSLKSVAVLPFADMSEKRDQEYFSDGLAEELIEQLGRTPGLKVIARTSSFSFKGKSDDIATKLKVAHVLEGSVRRSGDHLRVSTQLIRAESGEPLWSETFDREFKDVFAMQDEIAAAVVSALKVRLAGDGSMARGHGTTNPDAYNAFLLGRQFHSQNKPDGWRHAIEAYKQAIYLDPRYAEAYAELALDQTLLSDEEDQKALYHASQESVQKALELDPELAYGYSVRALIRATLPFDWAGAAADHQRALALEPSNSRVLSRYASYLTWCGRLDEAIAMFRKAIDQDPLSNGAWGNLSTALTAKGDYKAAYESTRHALSTRSTPISNFNLVTLQLLDGKPHEALITSRAISWDVFQNTAVAMIQYTLGDAKASQQALDQLISHNADHAAYQVAEVYAWRGEKDKAFDWLDRAYEQQDNGLEETKIDPRFTSLRSDPRFAALLRKLNFPP